MQNLRVAAAALHGVMLPAGEVFSFWSHVGRTTRRRGFVPGRELREGCLIPSIGGGLCQLSNALYDAALQAGFAIVERHAHSQKVPGSMTETGRDATVFWNYVDLRFRPQAACQLDLRLTDRELLVRIRALAPPISLPPKVAPMRPQSLPIIDEPIAESCETCAVESCFRHAPNSPGAARGITAWLVDSWWPEFDDFLKSERQPTDWLCTPLDGARLHLGPYRWNSDGFASVRQTPDLVLHRSLVSRRLAAQGAERQRALLRFDTTLARRYARMIPAAATHLVVSQNLLPFLWRDGALGGRTFDVLVSRLPLAELQATLDRAHARHPQSLTLADFRADPGLLDDESAALAQARSWITPHRFLAKLAGSRAVQLDWQTPRFESGPAAKNHAREIHFPAATLGRKGAYELRDAARQLDLRVTLGGPILECPDFWSGLAVQRADDFSLAQSRAVVLPAWVENQPRRLLRAAALGIPVIASEPCGLQGLPGIDTVPAGDVDALIEALSRLLKSPAARAINALNSPDKNARALC